MNSKSIQNAWWPRSSLKVLIFVILTGTFFRFTNLERKVYLTEFFYESGNCK